MVESLSVFDSSALDAPDFSATTDSYAVVNNAQEIQMFPARLKGIYELIAVTLLPFLPVALTFLPFEVILTDLGKLLV